MEERLTLRSSYLQTKRFARYGEHAEQAAVENGSEVCRNEAKPLGRRMVAPLAYTYVTFH